MVRKRYGIEVRQVRCPKGSIIVPVTSINRQFNNQFASFPVLLQKPNQTAHFLVDNCCPPGQWTNGQRRGEEVALHQAVVHDNEEKCKIQAYIRVTILQMSGKKTLHSTDQEP